MPVKRIDVRKGMRLVFDKDTMVHFVQGYGRIHVKADTELVVTGIRNDIVYGKITATTRSVWVSYDDVSAEKRLLGHTPEGALPPDDERVAWIFKDAARMADRLGLCKDFDRLVDALGFPGRMRTWKIVSENETMKATLEVEAHSRAEAMNIVRSQVGVLPAITGVSVQKAIGA